MDLSAIIKRKSMELGNDTSEPSKTVNTVKQPLTSEEKKRSALLERLTNSKAKEIIEKDAESAISEKTANSGLGKLEVKKICESVMKDYVRNDDKALKALYVETFETIIGLNAEVIMEKIFMSEAFINSVVEKLHEKIM